MDREFLRDIRRFIGTATTQQLERKLVETAFLLDELRDLDVKRDLVKVRALLRTELEARYEVRDDK